MWEGVVGCSSRGKGVCGGGGVETKPNLIITNHHTVYYNAHVLYLPREFNEMSPPLHSSLSARPAVTNRHE